MDRILLNGLAFFGYHGCHPSERELGQKFIVDIELECDLTAAGESDDLQDTIDYMSIYNAAREVIEGEPAQLLESLAQRIADFALRDERVESAWVRIRKPHIALPGMVDYLGVEITRGRDDEFEEADLEDLNGSETYNG
ncbi:MAG: dihydroneopterin aldolase, partial [Abitibacteriaceae bacterium]|nr:dihydroneopterin aldolase [Abditibacteriaceae bacterium]